MSLDDLTSSTSSEPSRLASAPRPKRSLAWLLPVGLLVGFILIITLLFGERMIPAKEVKTAPVITIRSSESDPPAIPDTSSVSTAPATGKGGLLFQASGWIEPDPYTVHAPTLINGVVAEVNVLEGEAVKKNDLLATLIDDDAKLNLQSAMQEFSSMEKRIVAHCAEHKIIDAGIAAAQRKIEALETLLDEARDTSSRLSRLSEGAVSKQQIVQARLATERQIAMIAEARAEIPRLEARRTQIDAEKETMLSTLDELATARDKAKLNLERTRIKSPINGIVLRLHAAPGKKRMLDMDDPLSAVIVELYDPGQLQARIDVPLNEAAALSSGQSVELVSDLLPDRTFVGTVTRISGQADLQRNTLQAKVALKSPDPRLRPDMLMRAKFFALASRENSNRSGKSTAQRSSGRLSIYVPEEALVSENRVWVISSENTAESRVITLGTQKKEGHRLVLEGLRSGELVILPPHADLSEGTRVTSTNNLSK